MQTEAGERPHLEKDLPDDLFLGYAADHRGTGVDRDRAVVPHQEPAFVGDLQGEDLIALAQRLFGEIRLVQINPVDVYVAFLVTVGLWLAIPVAFPRRGM